MEPEKQRQGKRSTGTLLDAAGTKSGKRGTKGGGMIQELLTQGRENARTARELADALGCTPRDITAAIERERRAGAAICASCGNPQGYYLAANEGELEIYCRRLKSRAIEIFKTRQALIKVLQQIQEQKKTE